MSFFSVFSRNGDLVSMLLQVNHSLAWNGPSDTVVRFVLIAKQSLNCAFQATIATFPSIER